MNCSSARLVEERCCQQLIHEIKLGQIQNEVKPVERGRITRKPASRYDKMRQGQIYRENNILLHKILRLEIGPGKINEKPRVVSKLAFAKKVRQSIQARNSQFCRRLKSSKSEYAKFRERTESTRPLTRRPSHVDYHRLAKNVMFLRSDGFQPKRSLKMHSAEDHLWRTGQMSNRPQTTQGY